MSSAGKFLSFLRSDKTRGLEASRPVRAILGRIQEWSWPFHNEAAKTVPVHVLAGKYTWRPAAWMLASWFEFSEHSWPIVIHDDGTLPDEARVDIGRAAGCERDDDVNRPARVALRAGGQCRKSAQNECD